MQKQNSKLSTELEKQLMEDLYECLGIDPLYVEEDIRNNRLKIIHGHNNRIRYCYADERGCLEIDEDGNVFDQAPYVFHQNIAPIPTEIKIVPGISLTRVFWDAKRAKEKSGVLDQYEDEGIKNIPIERFRQLRVQEDCAGVYILLNITNGKRYIGASRQVFKRVMDHFKGWGNPDVYRDYQARHKFVVERIITHYQDGTKINRKKTEGELIDYYDSIQNGYNRNAVKTSNTGFRWGRLV